MSDPQLEALVTLCRECRSILETLDGQQHQLALSYARNRITPTDYQGQQSIIVANRLQALQMLANLVGNPERHRKTLWELIAAEDEAVPPTRQFEDLAHLEALTFTSVDDDEPEARTEEPRNPMWEP